MFEDNWVVHVPPILARLQSARAWMPAAVAEPPVVKTSYCYLPGVSSVGLGPRHIQPTEADWYYLKREIVGTDLG